MVPNRNNMGRGRALFRTVIKYNLRQRIILDYITCSAKKVSWKWSNKCLWSIFQPLGLTCIWPYDDKSPPRAPASLCINNHYLQPTQSLHIVLLKTPAKHTRSYVFASKMLFLGYSYNTTRPLHPCSLKFKGFQRKLDLTLYKNNEVYCRDANIHLNLSWYKACLISQP